MGNIKNPSTTQNFIKIAGGILHNAHGGAIENAGVENAARA